MKKLFALFALMLAAVTAQAVTNSPAMQPVTNSVSGDALISISVKDPTTASGYRMMNISRSNLFEQVTATNEGTLGTNQFNSIYQLNYQATAVWQGVPNSLQIYYSQVYYGNGGASSEGMILTNIIPTIKFLNLQTYAPFYLDIPLWATNLDANGLLQPSSVFYPDGMPFIASSLHSNNIGLMLYAQTIDNTTPEGTMPGISSLPEANGTNLAAMGVDGMNYDPVGAPVANGLTGMPLILRLQNAFRSYAGRTSPMPIHFLDNQVYLGNFQGLNQLPFGTETTMWPEAANSTFPLPPFTVNQAPILNVYYEDAFNDAYTNNYLSVLNQNGRWFCQREIYLNAFAPSGLLGMDLHSVCGVPMQFTWINTNDYTTPYLQVPEVFQIQQDATHQAPFVVVPNRFYMTNYMSFCRRLSDGSVAVLTVNLRTNNMVDTLNTGDSVNAQINFTDLGFSTNQLVQVHEVRDQINHGSSGTTVTATGSFSFSVTNQSNNPYRYFRVSAVSNPSLVSSFGLQDIFTVGSGAVTPAGIGGGNWFSTGYGTFLPNASYALVELKNWSSYALDGRTNFSLTLNLLNTNQPFTDMVGVQIIGRTNYPGGYFQGSALFFYNDNITGNNSNSYSLTRTFSLPYNTVTNLQYLWFDVSNSSTTNEWLLNGRFFNY